jgi:hypothetical protein
MSSIIRTLEIEANISLPCPFELGYARISSAAGMMIAGSARHMVTGKPEGISAAKRQGRRPAGSAH